MAAHSTLSAYAKVCRLEYLRGEAPAVLIPALITTSSVQALLSPTVIEAVAVFAVLYLSGFIVNALADRDLDVKYDSFKREIGEATARLGAKRVRALLAAHLVVALALALHLSMVMRAPELFALAAAGTFLAMAYSLPPLHLKVRGVAAHAVALSLSAFAIPFLFLYRVAAGGVDPLGWGICAAFTLTHYGLTYTNQAYDYDLDLKEGVKTPPVRIGLKRSLYASVAMVGVGLPALALGVTALALSRPTIAAAWGTAGAIAIGVGTPALLWVGYRVPLRGLRRMIAAVREAPSEVEAVPRMREAVSYANFHAAGVGALAVFGLLLFAATVQSSAVLDDQAVASLTFVGEPTVEPRPLGGGVDVTLYIHNGGERTLPAWAVEIWITVSEAGSSGPAYMVKTYWVTPISPGETVTLVAPGLFAQPHGSPLMIDCTLRVDSNRDNLDLRVVDQVSATVP